MARKDRAEHDCVKETLALYIASKKNLGQLSNKVEEVIGDIKKQTSILDKLKLINNEKTKRVAEIESYLKMKEGP